MYVLLSNIEQFTNPNIRVPAQTAQTDPATTVQTLPSIQTLQFGEPAVSSDIANDIKLPGLQQSNIERNTTTFNLPKGVIVAWNSEIAPVGWALCDGTNGTPNLQGRFILGSNMNRSIGTIGGVETVALSVDQIPPHSHNLLLNSACFKDGGCDSRRSVDGTNIKYDAVKEKEVSKYDYQPQSTGGGKPHENMPPFYTLTYIMKL